MKNRPVRNINQAIRALQAAKQLVLRRKFERAENKLADSLTSIARALRGINRKEMRRW